VAAEGLVLAVATVAELEVLHAVVVLIAVYVVDGFFARQRTAEVAS
jgi:hypothetical protein